MTETTADAPLGWLAWLGVKGLNGLTGIVTCARRFASWFKSNYWHAFVAGLLAAWVMMLSHDVMRHPVTWAAWSAQSADKMLGIPVTMQPPVALPAKAEAKSAKKTKKTKVRQRDVSVDIKLF